MTIEPTNVSEGLERWLFDILYAHDPMCGFEDCTRTAAKIGPLIAERFATLSPPLPSPGVERLTEAARAVLAHRVGELPSRGRLRDTSASRKALSDLDAALSALPLDGGLSSD